MPVAATQATSKLLRFLTKNLDLKRNGGVLFVRDESTLILSDMYTMSNENLKNIEAHFPQVTITVMSSEGSRSGFLVIIGCRQEKDKAGQRSVLRLWMHFAFFVSTWLWAFRLNRIAMAADV
jgi:hypothetical protein